MLIWKMEIHEAIVWDSHNTNLAEKVSSTITS